MTRRRGPAAGSRPAARRVVLRAMPPAAYPWEQPLGAHPDGAGPGDLPHLGARPPSTSPCALGGADHPLADEGFGVRGDDAARRPRRPLRARPRRHRVARPVLALAARRPARALRGARPRDVRLDRRGLGGRRAARRGDLRAARRDVLAPRAPSTARSSTWPRWPQLGVTVIELMPVAEFPGARGWGYDGVYLSAAQSSYGGPEGLQRLVDAAHARGLAVLLDVVYNHVGASGAQGPGGLRPLLHRQARDVLGRGDQLRRRRRDPVREWVLQSAEGWIRDFHLDGLRLDAIHAIHDESARPIVGEVAARAHAARPGALVIAESGLNDPRVVRAPERGGLGCDAVWADDFHHALHVLLTGERDGYYEEFGAVADLVKAFGRPHVHDGELLDVPRAPLRRARGRRAARALRGLRPEPRPGRQPRARRPPAARRPAAGAVRDAAVAVHPDAVHGRGVRRDRAVSVLHRPHRPGDRRRDARGAAPRVRRLRGVRRRGRPRSRRRRRPSWPRSSPGAPIPPSPRSPATCSRCAASCRRATRRPTATRRPAGSA